MSLQQVVSVGEVRDSERILPTAADLTPLGARDHGCIQGLGPPTSVTVYSTQSIVGHFHFLCNFISHHTNLRPGLGHDHDQLRPSRASLAIYYQMRMWRLPAAIQLQRSAALFHRDTSSYVDWLQSPTLDGHWRCRVNNVMAGPSACAAENWGSTRTNLSSGKAEFKNKWRWVANFDPDSRLTR